MKAIYALYIATFILLLPIALRRNDILGAFFYGILGTDPGCRIVYIENSGK